MRKLGRYGFTRTVREHLSNALGFCRTWAVPPACPKHRPGPKGKLPQYRSAGSCTTNPCILSDFIATATCGLGHTHAVGSSGVQCQILSASCQQLVWFCTFKFSFSRPQGIKLRILNRVARQYWSGKTSVVSTLVSGSVWHLHFADACAWLTCPSTLGRSFSKQARQTRSFAQTKPIET